MTSAARLVVLSAVHDRDTATQIVHAATAATLDTLWVIVCDLDQREWSVPQLQILLEALYNAACKAQLEVGRPLETVVVLLDGISGTLEVLLDKRPSGMDLLQHTDSMAGRVQAMAPSRGLQTQIVPHAHVSPILDIPRDAITRADPSIGMYANVVLGGTFDHLHAGHRVLLSVSSLLTSKRVLCGITNETMVTNKKYAEFVEPLAERIAGVENFCRLFRPGLVYEVVPISDAFGPSIVDPDLQAIVVSAETYAGGKAVNQRRAERGLNELALLTIALLSGHKDPFTDQTDLSLKVSSTQLRAYKASLHASSNNTI